MFFNTDQTEHLRFVYFMIYKWNLSFLNEKEITVSPL